MTWIGKELPSVPGASTAVRDAARQLVESDAAFCRRTVSSDGVEIIRLDAIPIRRAHTQVGDLLARTMDAFLQQAHAADVELHVERADDVPPSVFVDGEKVAWALGALVGNAIRHAGDGTRRPATVRVGICVSRGQLTITVDDSGPGLSQAQAKWLFKSDPSTGRSTGTALRLVADVAAAHQGMVEAGLAPNGGGARFTLRLPRR